MVSSIFIILAAICNAIMDVLENENFHISIFKNLNQKFWYKRVSWEYAKKIFNYKIDAWHLAKSLMIIFICLAIVFYTPIFDVLDFFIYGIIWNLTFNVTYNKILK